MTTLSDGLRRGIDVVVAAVGLVALAPVALGLAVALRLTVGRPVVFRQRRLGAGGRPFDLYKFRSMRHPIPGREGPEYDTERITRVGRVLRSTSLDELPSLWNLLRGEVTLVGPRPLPVFYWPRFRGAEYDRFLVRPGITGLAQIEGRNAISWDDRLAIDVRYVRERSLRGDLGILVRTVPAVIGGAGVDAGEGITMTELPADRPG